MVLIHDIVEIDAGDTIVYDTKIRALAQNKESEAAKRIFGILAGRSKDDCILNYGVNSKLEKALKQSLPLQLTDLNQFYKIT